MLGALLPAVLSMLPLVLEKDSSANKDYCEVADPSQTLPCMGSIVVDTPCLGVNHRQVDPRSALRLLWYLYPIRDIYPTTVMCLYTSIIVY